jgi:hypothetical protein
MVQWIRLQVGESEADFRTGADQMVKANKFKVVLITLVCLTGPWAAWDDPPLVNKAEAITGVLNLNFGMPGNRQQIAMFLINSNDPNGFHVDFTFLNKGRFKSGTRSFGISNVTIVKMGGTLGPGFTPLTETALSVDGTTGIATWTPSGTPTGATEDLVVGIFANWLDQSDLLAGFYQENVSAVVATGN